MLLQSADMSQPKHESVPQVEMWAKTRLSFIELKGKRWKDVSSGPAFVNLGRPSKRLVTTCYHSASRHISTYLEIWGIHAEMKAMAKEFLATLPQHQEISGLPWLTRNKQLSWSFLRWRPARLWSKSCTAPGRQTTKCLVVLDLYPHVVYVCMSVCLSVGRSVGLSVCPSVRLSVCPSVRLSVRPSVRTYVCIVMYCNVL